MGSSSSPYLINFLLILLSIIIPKALGCYSAIFSFGDSITDTGNLYISSKNSSFHFFFPPYGETYFHRPTGRCSDGRLIIDFIAEYLGLPHVRPYLELESNASAQNFKGAVNFAMVGATALDAAFLAAMGDHNDYTNSSLRTQLDWFKEMLPSLCNTSSNCNKLLSSSLVLVGEIGGNDYNDALLAGKSIEQVQTYVPLVIEEISTTIKELIELGAMTLMVPGNFPIGCLPIYLTKFQTSDKRQYDSSTGCLNWLNKFAEYHNDQLQIELSQVQRLHPNVNIIYADYYNAVMHFYHSPDQFGFIGGTVEACCGGGGPYNYNSSAQCGSLEASACENPAQFINWDGIHFTEAAYRWIAKGLLRGKLIQHSQY
ncbi:GDSL esterase/lipase At1g28580-like isoform X1 [Rosa rugosa]|uniref:GDSL esterase/lipase At1g28580-like isoform X1 n=1 Tax=Rosa rugosa TaxID=74645 RepID=UPI002B407B54|nr:GDSL esterase/lipase At1g28580-like isoform X1 [Rosa rugosa]